MTDTELAPTLTEEERKAFAKHFKNSIWRIRNLYAIVDDQGHEIPFRPNPMQMKVLNALYKDGYRRQAILKARQLGMSTLIEIIMFDLVYWKNNQQASIVADTADNAKKLLRTKIRFAYEKLSSDLKQGAMHEQMNQSVLEWEHGSSVHAGTRVRSGTNQALHVSEWGKVASKDPERSREIKTGAIPTVHPPHGIIFVESTFEGGKGGDFYQLLKRSMETPPENMTDEDFLFQFFPWWEDPKYSLEGRHEQITPWYHDYFKELKEKHGIKLTKGQQLWYFKKRHDNLEDDMLKEYPSTPDEAFSVPVEGAIWGKEISAIRAKGHIKDFEVDHSTPIFTTWDIGIDNYTVVWWWQIVAQEILSIDHFRGLGLKAAKVAEIVRERPWSVHTHFLPHDANKTSQGGGRTYVSYIEEAHPGMNLHVLQRTPDVWLGINSFRELIKKMYFHKTRCATDFMIDGVEQPSGVTCLESYRMKWQEKEAIFAREPVHDWAADDADAARMLAEAWDAGVIPYDSPIPSAYQAQKQRLEKSISAFRGRGRKRHTPSYRR